MPLKISARAAQPVETSADIVVVGVWTLSSSKKSRLAELEELDRALGGGLARLIAKDEFKGKKDQSVSVPTLGRLPANKLVVLGLGDQKSFTEADARAFAAKASRAANAEKAKSLVLGVPAGFEARYRALAEGLELGAYRYTKYLTGDRKPKAELSRVTIASHDKPPASSKRDLEIGQIVANGVNISRDLSNEPPNVLTPIALAAAAQTTAKEHNVKATVFDFKEIQKRGGIGG